MVALAGLGVRAYVAGHVPQGTSGRNTRSQICEGLNTDGAYSMVRHPLYLGNFLIWLGVALVPRSAWLLLLVTAAFWIYYERIMYAEEEFLRNKFGERYLFWARTHTRVPAQPSALPSTLVAILASDRSSKGVLELVRGHRVVCVARDDGEFECSWSPRARRGLDDVGDHLRPHLCGVAVREAAYPLAGRRGTLSARFQHSFRVLA